MAEPAPPPLLEASGLAKHFGGFVALDNIDLAVAEGERLGLIGPNGSGKSTLVNCLCGTLRHDSGSIMFAGRRLDRYSAYKRTRLGLARSFQLPKPFRTMSLVDNLRIPLLYAVNARPGMHLHHAAIEERCLQLLDDVGLADKARRLPRDLTQVEMRKLELARAVASAPRLLFADEFDGRAVALRGRGNPGGIVPAEPERHHDRADRAHHARGDELFDPAGGAGGRA